MRISIIFLILATLLLSSCEARRSIISDVVEPVCVSGSGSVKFQIKQNLYRIMPFERLLPYACEVRTMSCEGTNLVEVQKEIIPGPCDSSN